MSSTRIKSRKFAEIAIIPVIFGFFLLIANKVTANDIIPHGQDITVLIALLMLALYVYQLFFKGKPYQREAHHFVGLMICFLGIGLMYTNSSTLRDTGSVIRWFGLVPGIVGDFIMIRRQIKKRKAKAEISEPQVQQQEGDGSE